MGVLSLWACHSIKNSSKLLSQLVEVLVVDVCCCGQCERVARVQKQMQTLWRNRVPMCIEVLLFANCRHGQLRSTVTDIAPPDASDSCVLLEQWTIQNVARRSVPTVAVYSIPIPFMVLALCVLYLSVTASDGLVSEYSIYCHH